MPRILHIARFSTVPAERRVTLMATAPGFSFCLVRPRRAGPQDEVEAVRARSRFESVTRIPMWKAGDPHRGVYRSLGMGIRRARPDLIHAEEEPDSLAALQVAAARRMLAPRARLVFFTWQNVDRSKSPAVRWVLERSLSAADAVICGNDGAVGLLRQFGFRGPTPRIPALGLDPDTFHYRPVPRPDSFTVGFVGRLAPEKGVETLIDAVAALGAPARLDIAGEGPARALLEAHAREAGLEDAARFVGTLDPDGVARFLSAIDVLVVPSRPSPVWQEQYGRVIVEAMGCGVPVIGSTSGAIPEVIGDAGLLFDDRDTGALVAHLRTLRDSPERRTQLGRRGYDHAMARHTISRQAAQIVDFYRELLAAEGRR
jgi:glycosyltransferase involved in cell wall biosynthesis